MILCVVSELVLLVVDGINIFRENVHEDVGQEFECGKSERIVVIQQDLWSMLDVYDREQADQLHYF